MNVLNYEHSFFKIHKKKGAQAMLMREGQIRIPSGCAIAGIVDRTGKRFSGRDIIRSIALMHDRSNGLGGGFAAYGIYPEYRELYAFHIFYDTEQSRAKTEEFLFHHFNVDTFERIPTQKTAAIGRGPKIWRYFASANKVRMQESGLDEQEYTARCVIRLNNEIGGAYVFSSGKNMGAFKAVGYPEDVGEYYMLEDYDAYLWTAHGRFPTNTPGWWGGAHPFTLLDWSIVHNGEISSYDANRRYVEQFGYHCNLQTDTEVITYLFDLLVRRQGLPLDVAASVLAAPEWEVIDAMPERERAHFTTLRAVYSGALINGPFSILVGSGHGLLALNDRLKLRSLITAQKGDRTYFASEESAIRVICPEPEQIRQVEGGTPVFIPVEGGII